MDENEIDKASQRANLIEQRMFEITLSSIDTLKHATAIEIHKSQNEMKKRLRKYRDRQREIVRAKPDFDKDPIEELITRQMKNKAQARQKGRPKTCPGGLRNNTPRATSITPGRAGLSPAGPSPRPNGISPSCNSRKIRASEDSSYESDYNSESDVELDGSFMIDQQKSKIDLRPKTALDIARRGVSLDQYVNNGRLGPPVRQVRYFDEDELKDRGHFYMHLVEKRIVDEKNKLNTLDDKVAEFCGSETIQTMTKKMQAKRKFFTRNTEWNDNVHSKVRSKTKAGARKHSENQISIIGSENHASVRPVTSVGFRSPGVSQLKSFKRPSYIATSR